MRIRAVPELFLGLLSLAVAAVWVGHLVASTIHDAKHARDTITITGSARKPIGSDLVQWHLEVHGTASTAVAAAYEVRTGGVALLAFLRKAGIPRDAVSQEVVQSDVTTTRIDKKHTQTVYDVSQGYSVSSRKIDVVQAAATRVGTLLEDGIDVSAEPLAYISTNLETAKLDALAAATAEARRRAEILVKGLGGKLGRVRASSLGVYQITPRNSTEISDYGVSDTSARLKDVTAVVTATFAVSS